MKLDELEVSHARTGLEGHGDAVPGRDRRIRRFTKDLARTARRDERSPGLCQFELPVATDELRASTLTAACHERHRECIVEDTHAPVRLHLLPEHTTDLATGRIARVEHASNRVRGLTAKRRRSRRIAIERDAPRDELVDVARTVTDKHVDRLWYTEAIPGGNRVREVKLGRVVRADRCGDSALRVAGITLARIGLREHDDVAGFRQRERGAKPGDAAADDQKVAAHAHGLLSYQLTGFRLSTLGSRQHAFGVPESAFPVFESRKPRAQSRLIDPIRIDVTTGNRTSPVWIGEGLSQELPSLLDRHGVGHRRFIVSSPVVWRFHGEELRAALGGGDPILLPDGERYKNLQSISKVYEALIRANADRGSTIIAVGGGVVGDSAGFAAATFLRGIALVHVPTTLLAQVDSSIGGKVGVNHTLGKNLIGAFHQPALVVIDPALLKTLPRREFRSGLYEVVKYGVIANRNLFDRLNTDAKAIFAKDPAALVPAIVDSCRIKADVVSKDERESGLRRILNFGHTVGHALEAVTHYRRFRHGEAIALGMLAAADLAVARGAMAERERTALAKLIARLGPLPSVTDLPISEAIEAIRRDKKVVHGRLHFVIAIEIGATITVDDVSEDELRAVLGRLGLKN